MNNEGNITVTSILSWAVGIIVILLLTIGAVFGVVAGVAAFSRYQTIADAQNQVQVNNITIAQTDQLVKVEQQKAAIRVADAQGIAQSQAIIAGSLTPNYLQYLAIQAQVDMAQKSDHSATVYIPVGTNGIPVVTTQPASH